MDLFLKGLSSHDDHKITSSLQNITSLSLSYFTKKDYRKGPVMIFLSNVAGDLQFTKKGLYHRCFPVNVEKFLRPAFLQNTSQ